MRSEIIPAIRLCPVLAQNAGVNLDADTAIIKH
jgi:hypothetical protein